MSQLDQLDAAYRIALHRLASGYGDLEECQRIGAELAAERNADEELKNFKLNPKEAV